MKICLSKSKTGYKTNTQSETSKLLREAEVTKASYIGVLQAEGRPYSSVQDHELIGGLEERIPL